MSVIILIIIVLIGFIGFADADGPDCAGDGCATAPTVMARPWMPVMVDGVDGVIVAEEDGPLFVEAESWWTPATPDISAAEEAIAAGQGALDHLRQYVGFVEDGERKILVNGFCDAFGQEWLSEPILVVDGGECFFEAVYNVETGELERFQFNGEA